MSRSRRLAASSDSRSFVHPCPRRPCSSRRLALRPRCSRSTGAACRIARRETMRIRISTCPGPGLEKLWGDDDCKADQAATVAVFEPAARRRVGAVDCGCSRRHRRTGCPGPDRPLVPGRSVEPGVGQGLGLGLAPMPRLAAPGRSVRPGRVGALGTAPAMGSAAAASTGLGTRRADDVESDRRR